ncbi:hypothetical protein SCLCIDRAFT_20374 [Scleroderma citrinum Foug A]|uniref:Uncharacterized protein n=1 Tax=Scleroderma citrinum Foug A TaxID=1036808 RepID=A0A0C3EJP0_9AGAM|nr:hypothetical protein SCLCIDRAFT_20374 [Scleroderma citrinum Foug A]
MASQRASNSLGPDASHQNTFSDAQDEYAHTSDDESSRFTDLSRDQFSYDGFIQESQDPYAPISSFSEVTPLGTEGLSDECIKDFKLWAQKVATKFELKATQVSELSTFIEVGKKLNAVDLCLRVWQQATSYRILNGVKEIKVDSASMKNAVELAASGLKGGFQLSVDQTMQVIITCKDMLIQAGRTKYKNLHVDVEEQLKSHAHTLGFQNVFSNPVNEQVLRAVIKECSGIRSKFCMLILDSMGVDGKLCMTLEEFVWTVLSKYK